jgi:hypothetical protein
VKSRYYKFEEPARRKTAGFFVERMRFEKRIERLFSALPAGITQQS